MTDSREPIDLGALARTPRETPLARPRRSRLRWLLPLAVFAIFAYVFADSLRDLVTEAVPVTIVRPRPRGEGAGETAGRALFQAAGWVEPDPEPLHVTALAAGVVESVLVQDADVVTQGQVVATLIADDARIARDDARAAHAGAKAEADVAAFELENAREAFDAAIEVNERLGVAKGELEARRAAVRALTASLAETEAELAIARGESETQQFLAREGAARSWQVAIAEATVRKIEAALGRLRAEVERAGAEVGTAEARLVRAERDLELRLEDHLRVHHAESRLQKARAELARAAAMLEAAELRLERMSVRAARAGVVLLRKVEPGAMVGTGESPDVCDLYDPQNLRVRVDVPQTQVETASVGQRAEIRTEAHRGKVYQGRVLRIIDRADIQKVTLEVQVRVVDPDANLRPDIVCQVTVYGAAGAAAAGANEVTRVTIPARCVDGGNEVWIVDGATGRAARRRVELGDRDGDHVIVNSGLDLSDKVIDGGRERLQPGSRLVIGGQ